jgi:hypothetical protein
MHSPRVFKLGLLAITASVLVLGASAYASSSKPITLKRCGYYMSSYGKTGLYPWKINCATAKGVAKDTHVVVNLSAGWDGAVVRYQGKDWVCTGQMGVYNCGYPYRPYRPHGQHGYKGPFTKDVEFYTCSGQGAPGCPAKTKFYNPKG